MRKNTALKFLNPILAALIASQALSALLHDLIPRGVFAAVHKGGGVLLAAGIVLHVTLNWSWVRANLLPRARAKQG